MRAAAPVWRLPGGEGDTTHDLPPEIGDQNLTSFDAPLYITKLSLVELVTDVAKRPIRLNYKLTGDLVFVRRDRTNHYLCLHTTTVPPGQRRS